MNVLELFPYLEKKGIKLQLVDGNLKIKAPENKLTPEIIGQLKDNKEEIVRFLQSYVEKQESFISIAPVEKKEYYVLSSAQKRMYILQNFEPGITGYNMPFAVVLEGALDRNKLTRTFEQLIHRHESFRTSFHPVNGQPVQRIHDTVDFEIDYFDLTVGEAKTTRDSIRKRELEIVHSFIHPFDLTNVPLFRAGLVKVGEKKHILLMDMHHIISDGTSLGVTIREFMKLYAGKIQALPALQYKDYAEWQQNESGYKVALQQETFWLDQFRGEIPVLDLPTDFSRPAIQDYSGSTVLFKIGRDVTAELNRLAGSEDVTLFMMLLSVYYVFLSKLSGQEDIVVGTPVAGRIHDDLKQIPGIFLNTLPLRNFPAGEKTFKKFLAEVKHLVLNAFDNQVYQYEELVEKIEVNRDAGRNPLFDTMLILQNTDQPEITISGLKLKPYEFEWRAAKFDLTLACAEVDGELSCTFEYSTALFKEETIKRFKDFLQKVLHSVLADPEEKLAGIQLISPEEKKRLLVKINSTAVRYPGGKTIHRLFEEQAVTYSDRCSIISGKSRLTYGELDRRANRLAFGLQEKGVGRDSIVAIKVERSIEMVIGILGILKAGGAYLPIAPDYPRERIEYILRDSSARVLLTTNELTPELTPGLEIVYLADAVDFAPKIPAQLLTHMPGQLCYIIYTSGSTGRPKGVLVEHSAVLNTVFAMNDNYPMDETDVYLLKTAYTFDVSAAELFGWFLGGGALAILEKGGEKDPRVILDTVKAAGVTFINFVPSMFHVFVEFLTGANIDKLFGLKYIFLAGEALTSGVVSRFREFKTGVRMENIYGPTEAAIYASMYSLEDWESGRIPIGIPLPNVELHILDVYGQLQPMGVAGELHIGGAGLARGYLNRPELTTDTFIHLKLDTSHFTRLYKTGDLCRWLVNGKIEFLGRIDHQVKVRGFRIELGEIEARLKGFEKIQEAVVTCEEKKSGEKYLCAYVTSRTNVDVAAVRVFLAQQLPGYMIPAFFMQLDKLPLNTSGKIDRRQLPKPALKPHSKYAAPESGNERIVAGIWIDILELDKIGLDDNLFEIGGNSMDVIRISQRLREEFSRDVSAVDLFRYPTIRSLATSLDQEEDEFAGKQAAVFEAIDKSKLMSKTGQTGFNELDVAVIGMAGRFPGARDIDAFWENIVNGVESISFFSDEELLESGVEPDLLQNPNYVKAKGYLPDIDCFDSQFFGYVPGEAEVMNPQTRILHETTWEALEDAGYDPGSYNGRIGLYAGGGSGFYWESLVLMAQLGDGVDPFTRSNLANRDFLCSRVAYKLGLKGPAYMVNTACSTSLVAIHLAVEEMLNGECDMALAGGVKVSLPHKEGYLYQPGMIMSPDGHCRAFDAAAQGTVGGEGAGIVVLKPLADAVANGDYIYAVVKGTAANNDGVRKVGFQAPSIEGQAEVIGSALYKAGVEPHTISYVEAHGTGTSLGDPVEIEALKLVFDNNKKINVERSDCAIGSVKTNIGHLDSAAGVAGFIKAVLSLKHRCIAPSLHFKTPNPRIDFENSSFYVSTERRSWTNDKYPLRAGVSSFGIGGTNVHVVLEEWRGSRAVEDDKPALESKPRLILLSAKSRPILDKMSENLANYLAENPALLADTAFTLQVGRKHMEYRKMVTAATTDETITGLTGPSHSTAQTCFSTQGEPKAVFMFSGQGAQYAGMGLDLYNTEPVFRDQIDRCFERLNTIKGRDVKEILYPSAVLAPGSTGTINETEFTQPLLFAVEYALAKLLQHWGITPYAMVGHSIGEYAAACLSGVFSLEDALDIVALRGRLMQTMPPGSMLSVPLPEADLLPLLSKGVCIAAINSPDLSVISGSREAIATFALKLEDAGFQCRLLHTSHAFHSAMMEPILAEFNEFVSRFTLNKPGIPFVSNVTGTWADISDSCSPDYWTRHLRQTVRFCDGMTELFRIENAVFLELGPGKTLATFARQNPGRGQSHAVLELMRHPGQKVADSAFILTKLGEMWGHGVNIDWHAFNSGELRTRIPLPKYPFKKKRFWIPQIPLGTGLDNMAETAAHSRKRFIESMQTESQDTGDRAANLDLRPGLSSAYAAPNPRDETMMALVRVWENLFGINGIGINDNFFELGGDSLKAMSVSAVIHKELDVRIPVADFFQHPTLSELTKYIGTCMESKHLDIEFAEEREYYALSPVQQRMYFLQQFDTTSTGYNLSHVMILEGRLDKDKLERVFKQLIARHDSLRTSFVQVNEQPVQVVHDAVEFSIEQFDPTTDDFKTFKPIQDSFVRAFELEKAPLIRAGLMNVGENRHIFALDLHHIAGDGTSLALLVREFMALYSGETLAPTILQYKDYSQWKSTPGELEKIKRQEAFWFSEFPPGDEIPVLNLPTDFSRPPVWNGHGSTLSFTIDENDARGLKVLTSTYNTTLYMVLFAIYGIFVFKLSGQEEYCVGTPTAGRPHSEMGKIVGMFVNTLVLRSNCTGEKRFPAFLEEVKEKLLGAFSNQDFQYDTLVEKIAVTRDPGRNPLFDTMFILQNVEVPEFSIPGLTLKPYPIENTTAKFDLTLTCFEGSDSIFCSIEYCTDLFKEETIHRFIKHFKQIIFDVTKTPEKNIAKIEILSEGEKQVLLYDFNDTTEGFPTSSTIYELFETQVDKTPGHPALEFKDKSVSFTFFDEKANQLANYLRIEKGLCTGDRVLVAMERSLELIFVLMAVMKAGGAYVPLDPDLPVERLRVVLNDASIGIVISQQKFNMKLEPLQAFCPDFRSLVCIDDPQNGVEAFDVDRPGIKGLENPAYVMYTSGSSGIPKGVLVEHQSIVNTLIWRKNYYDYSPGDVSLQIPPYFFDSSVTDIFTPLIGGARLVIMSEDERVDLGMLKEVLPAKKVTHFIAVPAFYNVMVEEIAGSLRGVKKICCAGEHFPDELIRKHYEKLPHVAIVNEYGPTENSVNTTAYELTPETPKALIGSPISNVQVTVRDRYLNLCPIGVGGEMCLSGASLARGYLNRPELTAERFVDFDRFSESHRSYKTGDLARWLPEGNLEFLGRLDNQVKIRGIRVEMEEIENHLMRRDDIKEAVVISRQDSLNGGERYLCAYVVPDNGKPDVDFRDYLSQRLPDYMIPAFIMEIDAIPFTSTGKINRNAFPVPEVTAEAFVAPETGSQKTVAGIWAEVLALEDDVIGIDTDFFRQGGHSLKATTLVSWIQKETGVKIKLSQVFKHPTVRALARLIDETGAKTYVPINRAEEREYYPLTPQQERLFVLQQLDPGNSGYNIPHTMSLKEDVDLGRMKRALDILIQRHESLRTSFWSIDDRPVQVIHDTVDFSIENVDFATQETKGHEIDIQNSFIRPFDLAEAPLFRAALIRTGNDGNRLMMDFHHIITDGTSEGLLTAEFMALYSGDELPAPKLHYKDYALWLNDRLLSESIIKQDEYWLDILSGDLPVLKLPMDYPRPVYQSFEGRTAGFVLTPQETMNLKQLGQTNGATLYMTLLAVFTILLSKLGGDEDIIIGTPIAGRQHPDTQNLIGMLVNTLPMRNYPQGAKSFVQFLEEVKINTIQAFENQECQFDRLVEKLSVPRDTGRNPVFDVMFNLLNQGEYEGSVSLVKEEGDSRYENVTAKFDLNLAAAERGERLVFGFEYCTKLFKADTIKKFIGYFKRIAGSVAANPRRLLGELGLLSQDEKEAVLERSQGPATGCDDGVAIHQLFEKNAAKHPGKIALVMGDAQVSYRALNRRANGLARALRAKGVTANTVVGLMVERSFEMIIAILAILKAGGAYLPIDADYPAERTQYMLENSGVKQILVYHDRGKPGIAPPSGVEPVDLREGSLYESGGENPQLVSAGEAPLYVIYTSGSTGQPKGVMLEHKNLVNLMEFQFNHTNIDCSRILQFTTISFDVSFQEIFSALLSGGRLYLIDKTMRTDLGALFSYVERHGIRTVFMPMAFIKTAFGEADHIRLVPSCIRHIVTAGEQLVINDLFKDYLRRQRVYLHNHYGPTEAHVVTTLTLPPEGELPEFPPIGKPVMNTAIYILDKHGNILPEGVAGELVIGGIQVGRGYVNKPEMTDEKFTDYSGFGRSYRAYNTGDLARYLPDGNIQFLGRIDHQVKIRGFRVEPGEIESRIIKLPVVKDAVVITRSQGHRKYLCAYYVPENEEQAGEDVPSQLRDTLTSVLPDYMVPDCFLKIDRIPLNPNGKVHRSALPQPGDSDFQAGSTYQVPATKTQRAIANVWQDVLGRERIGTMDNFFQLGGNSLDLVSAANKLRKKLDQEIPVVALFTHPTICALEQYLSNSKLPNATIDVPVNFVLLNGSPEAERHIFLVHEILGDVGAYMEFSQLLGTRFNIWGVEADKLRNYAPINVTVEQIAAKYIKQMKQIQPQGPYAVATWSWGGHLGMEMALQLERMGENLSLLAFFDCLGPDSKANMPIQEFSLETEKEFLEPFFIATGNKGELDTINDTEQLWIRAVEVLTSDPSLVEQLRELLIENALALPDYDDLTGEELTQYLNLNRSHRMAGYRYVPVGEAQTQVHYFLANQNTDRVESWGDYCRNPIIYHEITGDHHSIFRNKEHIAAFAELFKQVVSRVMELEGT